MSSESRSLADFPFAPSLSEIERPYTRFPQTTIVPQRPTEIVSIPLTCPDPRVHVPENIIGRLFLPNGQSPSKWTDDHFRQYLPATLSGEEEKELREFARQAEEDLKKQFYEEKKQEEDQVNTRKECHKGEEAFSAQTLIKALVDPETFFSKYRDQHLLPEYDEMNTTSISGEITSFSIIEIPLSKLKPFPDIEEALLRFPLELDEEALPYAEPQPYYKPSQIASCGEKKCEHGASCFINGIMNTYEEALATAQAISEIQGGNQIDLIYNSTLGIQRDLIKQSYINNNYLIPAGQLLKDHIMNYFESVDSSKVLHISAHSQGGAILNKILPEIPEEYRSRMYVDTYGTAGYVDANLAKRVRNVWHPGDTISKMADITGWEKAKEDGTLVILEDNKKPVLDAHGLMNGYLAPLQQNNQAFARGDLR